jgi:hypothetical protein
MAVPQLTASAGQRGGNVVASLAFHWDKPDELMTSLQEGLESRIVFTARLYEKRTGLLSFRGDRLLAQSSLVRRAYRDILTRQYVIVDEEGALQQEFETPEALLPGFLDVPEIIFAGPLPAGHMYVAARAELEPVRLMPPLTLVALIGTAAAYATPWVRSDVR